MSIRHRFTVAAIVIGTVLSKASATPPTSTPTTPHSANITLTVPIARDVSPAERERLRASITITPDDVRQRLAAHPYAYDEFSLSHIFVAVGPTRDGSQRSESEALARATALRKKLIAGADFATVAQGESDDPQTAGDGGELQPMLGMYVAAQFVSAISQLHDGEVSQPVRGPQGYHLILVQQHVVATYENSHKLIEAVLRDEAVDTLIARSGSPTHRTPDKAPSDSPGRR
ncbi:peptidylprolyl isomerase [Xanthomonas sp. NCPPB 2632]|uniref:peptidylprolyl isomerase n=1 Tax=Xanthomonas sp. NCPPB 2632 TaxID=3240912 RepID=UPI00351578C8